jgi:hypothetical protein
MFIAVGTGNFTTATSYDGKTWKGGVPYAGGGGVQAFETVGIRYPIMVAGGSSTNTAISSTIAVSYDDGFTWIPRGRTIFTTGCYCVAWNGTIWVAGGAGTNTFASSTDGYNWTARGALLITSAVIGVVWSSSLGIWVAVGSGTNQIFSSYDDSSIYFLVHNNLFQFYIIIVVRVLVLHTSDQVLFLVYSRTWEAQVQY